MLFSETEKIGKKYIIFFFAAAGIFEKLNTWMDYLS